MSDNRQPSPDTNDTSKGPLTGLTSPLATRSATAAVAWRDAAWVGGDGVTNTTITVAAAAPTLHVERADAAADDGGSWARVPQLPFGRHAHTCVSVGEVMVMFGGYSAGERMGDMLFLEENKQMGSLQWRSRPTVGRPPSARHSHSCIVKGGSMIVFGGIDFSGGRNDMHIFDVSSSTWKEVVYDSSSVLPHPRWGHKAVYSIKSNEMFVWGGFTDTMHNDLWSFNFETLMWKPLKLSGPLPPPRHLHSMVLHNEDIYIFGGFSGMINFQDMWCINIVHATSWIKLDVPPDLCPRRSQAACLVDDYFVIHGGRQKLVNLNDMWAFHCVSKSWYQIKAKGLPASERHFHTITERNGALWVIGGIGFNKEQHKATDLSNVSALILKPVPSCTTELAYAPCVLPNYMLSSIPLPILLQIFQYLPAIDLARLRAADKWLYSLLSQDILWKRHCLWNNPLGLCSPPKIGWRAAYFRYANTAYLSKAPITKKYLNVPSSNKILVLGHSDTGKKSIVYTLCASTQFSKKDYGARGVEFKVSVPNGTVQCLWEIFIPKEEAISQNSSGLMILFSVTSRASFHFLAKYYDTFVRCKAVPEPVLIVGNKSDLTKERTVSTEEAIFFALSCGALYTETTTRNPETIQQAFYLMLHAISTQSAAIDDSNKCCLM